MSVDRRGAGGTTGTEAADDVLGACQPVGEYRAELDAGRWWWSEEVDGMLGLEPGEVTPSAAVLDAHRHPDESSSPVATVELVASTGETCSAVHEILDARGRTRTLVVTGEVGRRGTDGQVVRVVGHIVDLTGQLRDLVQPQVDRELAVAVAGRSRIDQAKGVLMLALGMDEQTATRVLFEWSNRTNIKARELADRLVSSVSGDGAPVAEARAAVDQLLGSIAGESGAGRR